MYDFHVSGVFFNNSFVILCEVNAKSAQIGVITSYARQVGDLKHEFDVGNLDVEVKSVDGFQGRYKVARQQCMNTPFPLKYAIAPYSMT